MAATYAFEASEDLRLAVWAHLRSVLAALIGDLDAVLRSHLGSPGLRLQPVGASDATTAADLWVGRTHLRLVLAEASEPPPFALCSSPCALYLAISSSTACGRGGGIWIDPASRRWVCCATPTECYDLDDETALDGFFLSLIAT